MTESIVFGGGCFWCTEAVFQMLEGVTGVTSGYTGGTVPNPTYEQVCTGRTGHAEAIKIDYDSEKIKLDSLLAVFFSSHDPTTLNRQGNDVGTQYRSSIFYSSDAQAEIIKKFIANLAADKTFTDPIVTTVEPLGTFYPAELYHQNYYRENESQLYCQFVINPKIAKLRQQYTHLLKAVFKNG
jgi:peptide-methionine (S)-S-oxide reductase